MKYWPYPKLFAHRGGGSLAPENTLAAIKRGRAMGYIAVEFDVKLSKDNVAVLMHDSTLERTTNGVGAVKDKGGDELQLLDAGAWHSPEFKGERIPTLSEIAHFLIAHGVMANVEIKPCEGREMETGRLVAKLCSKLWRDHAVKPLISSFSFTALQSAVLAAPELPYGLLIKTPAENCLIKLKEIGCVSLHCNHMEIDATIVRLFQDNGYKILSYTVNEPERARELASWGIDGMFTDNLAVMAREFPGYLSPG